MFVYDNSIYDNCEYLKLLLLLWSKLTQILQQLVSFIDWKDLLYY